MSVVCLYIHECVCEGVGERERECVCVSLCCMNVCQTVFTFQLGSIEDDNIM